MGRNMDYAYTYIFVCWGDGLCFASASLERIFVCVSLCMLCVCCLLSVAGTCLIPQDVFVAVAPAHT